MWHACVGTYYELSVNEIYLRITLIQRTYQYHLQMPTESYSHYDVIIQTHRSAGLHLTNFHLLSNGVPPNQMFSRCIYIINKN